MCDSAAQNDPGEGVNEKTTRLRAFEE